MKETNNLNVKRLNSKVGRIVLFEAAFIVAAGAVVMCANSKYEKAGPIYMGTAVVDPIVVDTVEGTKIVGPEGYVYDSESNTYYKDIYEKNVIAEQERKEDINNGVTAVFIPTLVSAAVLPFKKRDSLLGKKIVEEENSKQR